MYPVAVFFQIIPAALLLFDTNIEWILFFYGHQNVPSWEEMTQPGCIPEPEQIQGQSHEGAAGLEQESWLGFPRSTDFVHLGANQAVNSERSHMPGSPWAVLNWARQGLKINPRNKQMLTAHTLGWCKNHNRVGWAIRVEGWLFKECNKMSLHSNVEV